MNDGRGKINLEMDGFPARVPSRKRQIRTSTVFLCAALLLAFSSPLLPATNYFVRADIDQDGDVKLNDAVWILKFLFQGQRKLDCFEAADANDDGLIIITDPIFTLRAIFLGGLPFPPPSGAPARTQCRTGWAASRRGDEHAERFRPSSRRA